MDALFETSSSFNILAKESTINGERIATIQNHISVYERRLHRFEEEKKKLGELIEEQNNLINKLGITIENMTLTPNSLIENQQQISSKEKTNETEYENSQHFYSHLNPDDFLQTLKKEFPNLSQDSQNPSNIQLCDIFRKFPFVESAFFDKFGPSNIGRVLEYIQTINSDQRKDFYNEIWSSLNNLPYYLSILFSLLDTDSFKSLAETIETMIAQSLNYSRVILYFYNSEKSVLTIEKQKVKMHHHLNDGVILNVIKVNKSIYIKNTDTNLTSDDKSILIKHKEALFIPIEEFGILVGFFDKIGHFTELDDLLAHSLTSIISEIGQVFQLKKRISERISNYQMICDLIIQLSSTKDINGFLSTLSKGLLKCFHCSHSQLFKVSQNSRCYWLLKDINSSKKGTPLPIGFGLIGYSISKKNIFSFIQPERSVLFRKESDRPEPNIHLRSIVVCPILDEKGEVKFAIVLYNKNNSESFSEEDRKCLEILSSHFNQMITSVINTNDLSNEIKSSNSTIYDLSNLVNFVSFVPSLDSITDISLNIPLLMKDFLRIEKIDIYRIDRALNHILMGNEIKFNVDPQSKNPIMKFILENQIKVEKVGPNESQIFVPLVGLKSNAIGLMSLKTMNNDQDNLSKSACFLPNMSHDSQNGTKLIKKFNISNNSKPESVFNFLSDNRSKNYLSLWSQLIGKLVEISIDNSEIKRLILLEERLLQSINILDKKTIRDLYQQIKFHLPNNRTDVNFTTPLHCINDKDDILENYLSLLLKFAHFPQNGQIFTFSINDQIQSEQSSENFNDEFPSSFNFNSFNIDENTVVNSLLCLMRDLDLVSFFNFNVSQFESCINFIRCQHKPKLFKNWCLSIDRIQFLTQFLKDVQLSDRFSSCQKAALFFYLLSINCHSSHSTEFYLESGSKFNISTIIFEAFSSSSNCSFFKLDEEDQSMFFRAIERLELIDECLCSSTNNNDLFVLTAIICSYSYLFRNEEISKKWVDLRFEEIFVETNEDKSTLNDLIKFQLEFDIGNVLQPAFNELTRQNYQVEKIWKKVIKNLNSIYSITL